MAVLGTASNVTVICWNARTKSCIDVVDMWNGVMVGLSDTVELLIVPTVPPVIGRQKLKSHIEWQSPWTLGQMHNATLHHSVIFLLAR